MAPTRGYRLQAKPASEPQSRPAHENTRRKQEKKHVSTKVLFKAASHRPHKREGTKSAKVLNSTTIAPKLYALGSSKRTSLGKSILTKRPPSPSPPPPPSKPGLHPLLSGFNANLATYRDNVTLASHDALNPAHDDLVRRLTASGPDSLPADFERAMQSSAITGKSLGEHRVDVRLRDSKGRISDGQIALGDALPRFGRLLVDQQKKLSDLWAEWHHVRQEIADLGAELLDDPSLPTQFGLEALETVLHNPAPAREPIDGPIAGLRDQVRSACEQSRKTLGKEAQEDNQIRKAKRDQWLDLLKKDS